MQASNNVNVRRIVKFGALGGLVLIALITLLTSIRSVDTGKVGVVTSYGKVTGRELKEGMSLVAPWGINNVTEYDVKTQKKETTAPSATKDLQDVKATIVLNYRINSGKISDLHQNVGKDYYNVVIAPQIVEVFKAISAKYTASELITERAAVKKELFDQLKERIQNNPEHKDRYIIQDVAITDFAFSKEFNAAIEAVQIANQKIAQARQELETTKVEAEKTVAAAKAAAEAQRLQQQSLTKELLQKMAIEKWDGQLPVYSTNGSTFFNIPTGR